MTTSGGKHKEFGRVFVYDGIMEHSLLYTLVWRSFTIFTYSAQN